MLKIAFYFSSGDLSQDCGSTVQAQTCATYAQWPDAACSIFYPTHTGDAQTGWYILTSCCA